jgi:glutamate--cysteine ligase
MSEILDSLMDAHGDAMAAWIADRALCARVPIYCSADVRDSGTKTACVDLNVFPAGFNNLCETYLEQAMASVTPLLEQRFRGWEYKRVLIIPEAHSRNKFYNAHLRSLRQLLERAGLDVTIASMPVDGEEPATELITFDGRHVPVTPVTRQANTLVGSNGEQFDWVLLNNDLSDGTIDWLEDLEQLILPPPCFGWHARSKYRFFDCYRIVVEEIAREFKFDPWLLWPRTDIVRDVDFDSEAGRAEVAAAVARMLSAIKAKYREYGIDDEPKVFIKNDTGTYGIGIMVVSSPEEVMAMNRKARNKMAVGKGRVPITSVVVQESVPTQVQTDEFMMEPVVYMVGIEVIGVFLRANVDKGAQDNLNARGMSFYRYCSLHPEKPPSECICSPENVSLYQIVGKLGALACALEADIICRGVTV